MSAIAGDTRSVKGSVLSLIRDEGPMPRAELARRLALSATTITRAVQELESAEVLAEGQAWAAAGAGRPATSLHIQADRCCVAAVQIGIGLVQLGIFNALGERQASDQFAYRPDVGAEAVLQAVAEGLERLCRAQGFERRRLRGIGVAVPGPVDASGRRMLLSLRLDWRNVPMAEQLEALTGLPVTVEHNVRAMALAEARFGQGKGLGSVAFVYLRAGLGAGLVVQGQPFAGGVHGAVEIGHLPMSGNGLACICGGRGCIETTLADSALRATVQALGLTAGPSPLVAIWQAATTPSAAPPAAAARAVESIVTPLATGLSALMTLLNPELVLLGGVLADMPEPMFDQVVQASWRGAFPLIRGSSRIERSQLGPDAGLAGGATAALDRFVYV